MSKSDESTASVRPKWRAPVFEELDILDGTETSPGDDAPGGDDDLNS